MNATPMYLFADSSLKVNSDVISRAGCELTLDEVLALFNPQKHCGEAMADDAKGAEIFSGDADPIESPHSEKLKVEQASTPTP